ncbi:MAG: hypothetical protein AB7S26_18015 [Sandaracinaceae bacterium]
MTQPHYLRFARALALAAALPACNTASPPDEPPSESPSELHDDAGPLAELDAGAAGHVEDAGLDVDAEVPFSSGPIVPPELPEGFA